MKACEGLRNLRVGAEDEQVTLRNRMLRSGYGERLGLTVDLPELFDQSWRLWDYQALSRLPE